MEFEILMRYYSELTALKDFMPTFGSEFFSSGIIKHGDMQFMKPIAHHYIDTQFKTYGPKILLTRMAHHILSGNTSSFYKMLNIMESHSSFRYLLTNMQAKIVSLDRKMLNGM